MTCRCVWICHSIDIVNRDVRKHPRMQDVLLINVAFENRAAFIQPYPLLEVNFTDQSGNSVAMRRFRSSGIPGCWC